MNTDLISFPIFGENFLIDAPRYITIFGFRIYLYGLFITAGFALAALYLIKRHEVFGLTKDNILDLVIMAVPCGLVGSRIYYVIFNAEQYFGPGKWQNIIMFREGGLAIYGGVIGGLIAVVIYSRVKKIRYSQLLDAAGFGLLIGQSLGRWGNFFNREAYGSVTDVPWRMGLETAFGVIYVHPTFLYEMLWNCVGFLAMHIFSKKRKAKYPGQYFLFYVAWYGFGRFMIEGLRSDSLFIRGTDIRVSQLLAAASFSVAVIMLIRNYLSGKQEVVNINDQGPADGGDTGGGLAENADRETGNDTSEDIGVDSDVDTDVDMDVDTSANITESLV